jgi:hypothetical protein
MASSIHSLAGWVQPSCSFSTCATQPLYLMDLEIGVDPRSMYKVVVKRNVPIVPDRNHSQVYCVSALTSVSLGSHTCGGFEYSAEAQ